MGVYEHRTVYGPFAGVCGNLHRGSGHLWVGALPRLLRISEDGSFVV